MKYFLLLSLLLSASCKSITLGVVNKQIVTPGISTGVTKIKYATEIKVQRSTRLKSIIIENQEDIELDFSITDLKDGRLLNANDKLVKGVYFVEIYIPFKKSLENSVEVLEFRFKTNKEIVVLKQSVLLKPLHMK